jgi:hypothetical protein
VTYESAHARAKIDFGRFRALAPVALAAHNSAFYLDEVGLSIGRIVGGTLPLVGLAMWGWSAGAMLALLLIGYWIGVVVDAITLSMLARSIVAEAATRSDTQYVWSVVEALQKGSDEYDPSYSAPYSPMRALVLDVVLGIVASAMLWAALRGTDTPIVLAQPGRSYLVSVLIVAAMALSRLAVLFGRRNERAGGRRTGYAAGMLGVGLLILAFAVGFLGEAATPQIIVAIADGGLILLGVMGVVGLGIVRSETTWLRDYLAHPSGQ